MNTDLKTSRGATLPQTALVHVIAALAQNRCIGIHNQLPWHIPEDLAHFKKLTEHQHIIMGRKTWDSIMVLRGKPLPNRHHVVISRSELCLPEGVDLAHSLPDAIARCHQQNHAQQLKNSETQAHGADHQIIHQASDQSTNPIRQIYVMGGAQIYKQAISLKLADVLELTWVATEMQGDAFFPVFDETLWQIEQQREQTSTHAPHYGLRFARYRRQG